MGKLIDLSGQRFGRWLVLSRAPSLQRAAAGTYAMWLCRCDCGTERAVHGRSLRRGASTGCGCGRLESVTRHGGNPSNPSPTQLSWRSMLQRCNYPGDRCWHMYGGRGITVCERWRSSFANFLADMGERPAGHTLDRIDTHGNYEPGNCRWATPAEQGRNTRVNRLVRFNGCEMTLAEAGELAGLNPDTISRRIAAGWPEALWFEPSDRSRQRVSAQSPAARGPAADRPATP